MALLEDIAPFLGVVFGALITLFVYSILWKENPLSRAAEHLFIGLAAAYITATVYDAAMKVAVLTPGRLAEGNIVWALPIIIGFMYLFFFTKKYFWLYRFPVATVAGIGAGLVVVGNIQTNFVAQIAATVQLPLWGVPMLFPLDNIIIILGVITALSFFFFTFEQKGPLGISARVGRYVMMAAFGSAYGFTVMARVSLLIGRLRFLYETEEAGFWAYYMIPVVIVLLIIIAYWERTRKPPAEVPTAAPPPAAVPPPTPPPVAPPEEEEKLPKKRKKAS